jgi:coenzyme F420-reducing hydrogenase beta subunit
MVKRLENEVWALDNCAGCGMCVAACSKQVLAWNGGEHPHVIPRQKNLGYSKTELDSCSFCQRFCEETCPRLERWTPFEAHATLAGRARGPVKSGAPNDVIRAILAGGRSAGLIDGVLMLDLDPWELKPVARLAETVEDIVDNLGPQYLWAPVFDALNEAVFERGFENLAVVSAPCAAQAIRKLRASTNPRLTPYQDAIRLSVSIFCTGTYRPEMVEEILVNRMGIKRDQVKYLEVSPDRQSMQAVLWDNSVHTVSRQQSEAFTRTGCGACDDYLGESADLAVGTVGAPPNASTIIIRSRAGDIFVRNAMQMNLLETAQEVDLAELASAAEEKDRRTRAQAFKDLRILMLDALADPVKHNEAVTQFVRLYRTPQRSGIMEKSRNGCTGC